MNALHRKISPKLVELRRTQICGAPKVGAVPTSAIFRRLNEVIFDRVDGEGFSPPNLTSKNPLMNRHTFNDSPNLDRVFLHLICAISHSFPRLCGALGLDLKSAPLAPIFRGYPPPFRGAEAHSPKQGTGQKIILVSIGQNGHNGQNSGIALIVSI